MKHPKAPYNTSKQLKTPLNTSRHLNIPQNTFKKTQKHLKTPLNTPRYLKYTSELGKPHRASPGGVVGEAPIEQAHLGEQHLVDEGHVLQLLDPHVHLEAVLLLANHKAVHFVG